MYELKVTAKKVMGKCTACPPVKPGDHFTVRDGDIQVPEGGWICLWALQSLIPVLTPKERAIAEEKDRDWMWRVHHAQCPDPNGRVVFQIERTGEVEPEITLDPSTGAAGDRVKVNGTGFGSENNVYIEFDSDEVIADETDEDGSFEVIFTVPVKSPGSYEVDVEDEEDNKASADFDMAAGITLSPNSGNVETEVTVSGTGFNPNATVTVTYAPESEPVAKPTADANGKFSANFTVPKSAGGSHNASEHAWHCPMCPT